MKDLKTELLHFTASLHREIKALKKELEEFGFSQINSFEYERLEAYIEKDTEIVEKLTKLIK